MRLLLHPGILKMMGLGLFIGATLVLGFVAVRKLRKEALAEMAFGSARPRADAPAFALATYQAVIAGLKQSESNLKAKLAAAERRAEWLEIIRNTVLENVPTGVMFFAPNLLLTHANAAARSWLGYASPLNMHVREVFRGVQAAGLHSDDGAVGGIGQAVRDVFVRATAYRDVPVAYSTPSGIEREFRITLLPMGTGEQVTTALCLISDPAFTLSFPAAGTGRNAARSE